MFERGSGASSRCRRHLAVAELEGADAPAAMSNRRCQLLAGFLALPQPWSSQCLAVQPLQHTEAQLVDAYRKAAGGSGFGNCLPRLGL